MKPEILTVAYADDHLAVRKGIIAYLESDGTIKVKFEGKNGEELLQSMLTSESQPDVCLIDINMPKMDGFALLKEIKRRWPKMPCLIFTVFEFETYIIEMIKCGANGYLAKNCDPDELIVAVHAVYKDGFYYSDIANNTTFGLVENKKFRNFAFTEREVEFLKYVCSELSYADIAVKMQTTYKTIDGIRERVCIKLGVNTRTGLILASIQLGYFTIESSNLQNNNL